MLPKMPASVASLWRHQNAGFLMDPGFMSLCCNHISCRVVHVTPRGSAAHLSSDTFIFPSLPPHGGLTPLPSPTYAFLVFSFFFFTVISLRNQYFQSPILCGTCSSQAFKPLHSIKIGHDEALSSHLIAKSNGQLSVFMLLSLSTG